MNFRIVISIAIAFIHIFLYACGVRVINIDNYWQLLNPEVLNSDPVGSIFFQHNNPPLLSLIFWMLDYLTNGNKYIALNLILPIFHLISFNIFYLCLEYLNINKKLIKISCAVFFLNPLMFVYFLYPFYSTFLFFSSILIIYSIISPISIEKRLLYITIALSFNSLIRSSYHIMIVLMFIFPLIIKANIKYILISCMVLTLPLSIYIKNYVLFDSFLSSSWMGMNLADHIPPYSSHKTISELKKFSRIDKYKKTKYWGLIEFESQKYNYHESLNLKDYNNYRYIVISRLYLEDLKTNFDIIWSTLYIIKGFFVFFESSSNYRWLNQVSNKFFISDIFDLPNLKFSRIEIPISWYHIFYSVAVIFCLVNFKKLDYRLKYLVIYLICFSLIYISVDNKESMRMRFEIEPIYFFLLIAIINMILQKKILADIPRSGSRIPRFKNLWTKM